MAKLFLKMDLKLDVRGTSTEVSCSVLRDLASSLCHVSAEMRLLPVLREARC
jgi:hypothetical protein